VQNAAILRPEGCVQRLGAFVSGLSRMLLVLPAQPRRSGPVANVESSKQTTHARAKPGKLYPGGPNAEASEPYRKGGLVPRKPAADCDVVEVHLQDLVQRVTVGRIQFRQLRGVREAVGEEPEQILYPRPTPPEAERR
jgi:hypothetical protein